MPAFILYKGCLLYTSPSIPVAEEAALTAEAHGNEVVRLYDVGVAGLHRLLAHMDEIMSCLLYTS